ncbi:Peroxide operon regulator [Anaerohalosphaera lusitana]|uniref:Peroxide operon regulator n=1 Tax=Anaerohalosphaera lusitana TaxID=1936003 RepID=A0A1U9NNI5_9BACT|nr:Fur family transcriptional regulator [Anaerohalosphaera lusitana]AQT69357.1 Peroxide operon regulator [Anaerohalosphaera lusitana]
MSTSNSDKRAKELLSKAKLRRTKQRVDILSALLDGRGPMSQEQISDAIDGTGPNKATVYRAMESLVGKGVVHRAFERNGTCYFELGDRFGDRQCHPHFTCTECNRTHCLTDFEVPMVKSQKGFQVSHQKIELEGMCPRCADRQEDEVSL